MGKSACWRKEDEGRHSIECSFFWMISLAIDSV
jgi:hypothetical protein